MFKLPLTLLSTLTLVLTACGPSAQTPIKKSEVKVKIEKPVKKKSSSDKGRLNDNDSNDTTQEILTAKYSVVPFYGNDADKNLEMKNLYISVPESRNAWKKTVDYADKKRIWDKDAKNVGAVGANSNAYLSSQNYNTDFLAWTDNGNGLEFLWEFNHSKLVQNLKTNWEKSSALNWIKNTIDGKSFYKTTTNKLTTPPTDAAELKVFNAWKNVAIAEWIKTKNYNDKLTNYLNGYIRPSLDDWYTNYSTTAYDKWKTDLTTKDSWKLTTSGADNYADALAKWQVENTDVNYWVENVDQYGAGYNFWKNDISAKRAWKNTDIINYNLLKNAWTKSISKTYWVQNIDNDVKYNEWKITQTAKTNWKTTVDYLTKKTVWAADNKHTFARWVADKSSTDYDNAWTSWETNNFGKKAWINDTISKDTHSYASNYATWKVNQNDIIKWFINDFASFKIAYYNWTSTLAAKTFWKNDINSNFNNKVSTWWNKLDTTSIVLPNNQANFYFDKSFNESDVDFAAWVKLDPSINNTSAINHFLTLASTITIFNAWKSLMNKVYYQKTNNFIADYEAWIKDGVKAKTLFASSIKASDAYQNWLIKTYNASPVFALDFTTWTTTKDWNALIAFRDSTEGQNGYKLWNNDLSIEKYLFSDEVATKTTNWANAKGAGAKTAFKNSSIANNLKDAWNVLYTPTKTEAKYLINSQFIIDYTSWINKKRNETIVAFKISPIAKREYKAWVNPARLTTSTYRNDTSFMQDLKAWVNLKESTALALISHNYQPTIIAWRTWKRSGQNNWLETDRVWYNLLYDEWKKTKEASLAFRTSTDYTDLVNKWAYEEDGDNDVSTSNYDKDHWIDDVVSNSVYAAWKVNPQSKADWKEATKNRDGVNDYKTKLTSWLALKPAKREIAVWAANDESNAIWYLWEQKPEALIAFEQDISNDPNSYTSKYNVWKVGKKAKISQATWLTLPVAYKTAYNQWKTHSDSIAAWKNSVDYTNKKAIWKKATDTTKQYLYWVDQIDKYGTEFANWKNDPAAIKTWENDSFGVNSYENKKTFYKTNTINKRSLDSWATNIDKYGVNYNKWKNSDYSTKKAWKTTSDFTNKRDIWIGKEPRYGSSPSELIFEFNYRQFIYGKSGSLSQKANAETFYNMGYNLNVNNKIIIDRISIFMALEKSRGNPLFPEITQNIFNDICYKGADGNGAGLSNTSWDAVSCLIKWNTKDTSDPRAFAVVIGTNGKKPIANYTYDKMWIRYMDHIFINWGTNSRYQTITKDNTWSKDLSDTVVGLNNRVNPKPYFLNRDEIKYLHNDFTKYELENWLKNTLKTDEVKTKFKASEIAAFAYKVWIDPLTVVKTDIDYTNNQKTIDLNNWLNSKNRLVKKSFADSTIAKDAYDLWVDSQYNDSYNAKINQRIWANSVTGKIAFGTSSIAATAYGNYEGINDASETAYKASKTILTDLTTWIITKADVAKTKFVKWADAQVAYDAWSDPQQTEYTEAKYWTNATSITDLNTWIDAKGRGVGKAETVFKNWDLAIKNWNQWKSNQYLAKSGKNADTGKNDWFNKDEAVVEFKKSFIVAINEQNSKYYKNNIMRK